MSVYERLKALSDANYQVFFSKLVPNIEKDRIIGVKAPNMQKIVKEISDTKEALDFMNELPHKYLEENLVHMLLIYKIKDFDKCLFEVEKFLPYVDCWPVSDQKTPQVFKKNHKELISLIEKWISSDEIYISRYGIKLLMSEFLDADFKPEYLEIVANKAANDYYLKMMIAWYFATALAKQYASTIIYFENNRLEDWIHNKAIQKALESYRVKEEHKVYLKTLKR